MNHLYKAKQQTDILNRTVQHSQTASTAHMEPNVPFRIINAHNNNHRIRMSKANYTICNNALIYIKCVTLITRSHYKIQNRIAYSISLWIRHLLRNSFILLKNQFLKINSAAFLFKLTAKFYQMVIKHIIMSL